MATSIPRLFPTHMLIREKAYDHSRLGGGGGVGCLRRPCSDGLAHKLKFVH